MLVYLYNMIDKIQAKPLYQVAVEAILEKIEDGEYQPNSRIPSESELTRLYDVGRNTVRRAISELVNRGVLVTVHGVGTFVADNRLVKTAEYLYGFSQEMAAGGKKVSSRVLQAELIPADPFLSRRLGVQLGAEVVFLNRLRFMDSEPTAIERAYLPHELCRGILEYDFTQTSLYNTLSNVYGKKPDHAEQEIEAKLATPQVAKLLKLSRPAVVLVFHRETHLQSGAVIEYVDSELRADRFRFYANLRLRSQSDQILFKRLPVSEQLS